MPTFYNQDGLLINELGISHASPGDPANGDPGQVRRFGWGQVKTVTLVRPRRLLFGKGKLVQLVVNQAVMFETEDEGKIQQIMSAMNQAAQQRARGQAIGYRAR